MEIRGQRRTMCLRAALVAAGMVLLLTVVPSWVQGSEAPRSVGAQSHYLSCQHILVRGDSTGDGVYTIDPDGPGGHDPLQVYCDMTTDGGGWTLVGSTKDTTFNDQASGYYADLVTLSPAEGHEGIWDGMRPTTGLAAPDVRFSCRDQAYTGTFDVDLAFYEVPWYGEITASPNDADVCFEEGNGAGQTLPPPARKNLLTGETRGLGDQWNSGFLEGEDSCGSLDDFTVDFDDRGMDSQESDGTDWGEDDFVRKCGQGGISGGTWFVWIREFVGVFLTAEPARAMGAPGSTLVYTATLENLTGEADSFALAVSGNVWPTTLSISNTGPLSAGGRISFTLQVDVPLEASAGDADIVSVQATSVASPTAHVATTELETQVICSPNLVLSGESEIAAFHEDTFSFGEQGVTHILVHAHTGYGYNTINGALQGYDRAAGAWQTLGRWGGAEPRLVDLYHVPPRYSAVRVDLHDASVGDNVSYDYRFIVCRAPAVALNPRSDQQLSGAGTTAVYTQTVTNYAMTEQSFDLSASGSSWPTTFWNNDTQITNTGPLTDQETFTYTVRVTVPPGASAGDADEVTITALAHPGGPAIASPAISDTASLRTSVLSRKWAHAFRQHWAPDGTQDPEQYLALVPASGMVTARVTDDGAYQSGPAAVVAYPRHAVVTAWTSEYRWNGSASRHDIEYATFDGDGDPVLPVTLVSDNASATGTTYDYDPAPAVDPTNGNVLFAWHRYAAPAWSYDVHYAVHDPAGGELCAPTALTTNSTSAVMDLNVSAAAFGDGGFAVVWKHDDNYVNDIHYAVVGSSGELITGPVPLTSNTWEDDYGPRANRLADGNVLLAWHGYHGNNNVYYAVVDSAGGVIQPVTQLTDAPHVAQHPDAVALRGGETVVAWGQSGYYPEWGYQVAYAVLDDVYVTATLPITAPAIITNPLSNDNEYVSLARDGEDNAVVTWRDRNYDRIYYALVDAGAAVLDGPLVLVRTRGQGLDVGSWGANSGSLPRRRVFLPLVLRGLAAGR